MYGAAKPVRFHSDRWLQEVRSNGPGSAAGLDTAFTTRIILLNISRGWPLS
jgi:hypothetical protein